MSLALLRPMYSGGSTSVNVLGHSMSQGCGSPGSPRPINQSRGFPPRSIYRGRGFPPRSRLAAHLLAGLIACDPALTTLFTPRHPRLGRYEVCTTDETPTKLMTAERESTTEPGASSNWSTEALEPLDAFGGAGSYDRSALARLYGGQRVTVARRWHLDSDRFESVTLLSPYPDTSFSALRRGTMIIRWSCTLRSARCAE